MNSEARWPRPGARLGNGARRGSVAAGWIFWLALSLDSLFIAYAQNTKPSNEPEMRASTNGLFQLLQNPSAYNPYVYARRMRKVHELLR